jgi:hypothetical protein
VVLNIDSVSLVIVVDDWTQPGVSIPYCRDPFGAIMAV